MRVRTVEALRRTAAVAGFVGFAGAVTAGVGVTPASADASPASAPTATATLPAPAPAGALAPAVGPTSTPGPSTSSSPATRTPSATATASPTASSTAKPTPAPGATPTPTAPPATTTAPDDDEPVPVATTPPLTPAQLQAGRDLAAAQRQLTSLTAEAAAALQVHATAVQAAEAASLRARVERHKLAVARAATAAARDALGSYAAAAYRNGPTGRDSVAGIASLLEADDPAQLLQRSVDIATVGRGRLLAIEALQRAEYDEDLAGRSVAAAASGAAWAEQAAQQAKETADAAVSAASAVVAARLVAVGGTTDVSGLAVMGAVPAGACQGGSTEGFPDGQIPLALLCPLWGAPGHLLRADAAARFNAMSQAYAATFGRPICVTDSYRDLPAQIALYASKPTLAAVPGTSNHGWARAVDLCDGVESFGTVTHQWLLDNAPTFGWFHPAWAEPTGSRPEPWHWEFGG